MNCILYSNTLYDVLSRHLDNTSYTMYNAVMSNQWKIIYYENLKKVTPVKAFVDTLDKNQKSKVFAFFTLLQEKGPNLPRPYADLLKDGIHELRIKITGDQYRVLYFFCYQEYIILTNVFNKTTDKVPESEINIAKKSRDDFLARITENELGDEYANI